MKIEVKIAKEKIGSPFPGFPVLIDLSDMPVEFWGVVKDGGGDIRCYAEDGTTEIPRNIRSCDKTAMTGYIDVQYSLTNANDNIFFVDVDGIRNDYLPTDPFGRNNTFVVYEAVYDFTTLADMTGKHPNLIPYNADKSQSINKTIDPGFIGKGYDTTTTDSRQLVTGGIVIPSDSDFSFSLWMNYSSKGAGNNPTILKDTVNGTRFIGGSGPMVNYGGQSIITDWSSLGVWTVGQWKKLFYVLRPGMNNFRLFYDDSKLYDVPAPNTYPQVTLDAISIGQFATSYVAAKYDEIRISSVAFPDDWVYAEYANQSSPSTFYSLRVVDDNATKFFIRNGGIWLPADYKVKKA